MMEVMQSIQVKDGVVILLRIIQIEFLVIWNYKFCNFITLVRE